VLNVVTADLLRIWRLSGFRHRDHGSRNRPVGTRWRRRGGDNL